MDDPTKDTIPRSAVEYCLRKETVNTNPDAYESHERFIAYMDDPDISQFGHWMHSNGFNCALTAISVDLEKIPSVTPSAQPGYEDAVSRKAAIDALPYLLDYEGFKGESGYVSKNLVRTMLKELPSVTPKQPGWIPCSKKLPELNRSVLVQLSDDFVDQIQIMTFNISKCEGDFFYFWKTKEMGIDFDMDDVVAWMPLPKLWEGEGLDG